MSALTMKAIMGTFEAMLEEMPLDKITVLELVKRSEVSHNTFYYHFQDIYELLGVWLSSKTSEILKGLDDPKDWKAEMTAIFMACKNHPKIMNHILESLTRERLEYYVFSRTDDLFTRYVRVESEGRNLSEAEIDAVAEFCRYAFAGYFLKFNFLQQTPDVREYVEKFAGMFDALVNAVVQDA